MYLDEINKKFNFAYPGKIAKVYPIYPDQESEAVFISSIEEFDPKRYSLLPACGTLEIYTNSQKQLAEKEIAFLISEEAEGCFALYEAIIKYLEEQLEFLLESSIDEVGD